MYMFQRSFIQKVCGIMVIGGGLYVLASRYNWDYSKKDNKKDYIYMESLEKMENVQLSDSELFLANTEKYKSLFD